MKFWLCVLLLHVANGFKVDGGPLYVQPEQIHLAYGASPSEMVVTWVTMSSTALSLVEYGKLNLNSLAKGSEEEFVDGGTEKRNIFMHRVTLKDLTPGDRYVYHAGSPLGWSEVFMFSAMQSGQDWSPRLAIYGDMGNVNAQSLGRLQEETQRGHFDAILHVGDFAYDMDTDNARVGDEFMNQVESIAAYVPYMTVAGNHEEMYNFSNYMNRFTMPGGDGHGMFYSYDVGPIHFVGINSEYYYFTNYGTEQIGHQFQWLEEDLKKANEPENRAKRPWIVTMCHRPLYSSNTGGDTVDNVIRKGLPTEPSYSIEDLIYKHGVDIHFQAHIHSYERMWPVYNRTVCNGTGADPYKNPRAPVHIVTGSAGCQERTSPFHGDLLPWSAYHSDDYGYTRMTVHNNTHVYIDQVSDDQKGTVIDKIWIQKDKHMAGMYDCHTKTPPLDDTLSYKPYNN